MEIITNIYYKPEYQISKFTRTYFGLSMTTPIQHKVLASLLDNSNLIQAIEKIMARTWQGIPGLSNNQKTLIELADDDFANVLLLKSAQGDKLTIMVMGNKKYVDYLTIAFVGSKAKLEEYLKVLNIPEIAIYSNLLHLEED